VAGAALLLLAALAAPPDTTVFADSATRLIVELGMARHRAQDSLVHDYLATFKYRISYGIGRRRWANVPNVAVEEQAGRLHWAQPNDLRLEILGRRSAARSQDFRIRNVLDEPWFIPRTLSDSLRVFGNDVPSRPAIHPLAEGGPDWYHYRLDDSVTVSTLGGQRVKLLGVEVTPRRVGVSLITGRLWLDAESGSLVRFTFRFVGTALWLDADEDMDGNEKLARRANALVNRILTLNADLEYALQDGRHWMPYRQTVSGRVELPWFGELVVPFEARTEFDDYAINTGEPVQFTVPLPPGVTDPDSLRVLARARRDSIREERSRQWGEKGEADPDRWPSDHAGRWDGGRYEIHRAPGDSLEAFGAWETPIDLSDDPYLDRELRRLESDLERMAVDLPPELTGQRRHGFDWEHASQWIRYNRVQGFAPGIGYRVRMPGDGFTTLRGDVRFGFSDERVTGGLTVVREAPGARWTLRGYREVESADPFARGNSLSNTLNAVFAAHDDADYLLANGARLTREGALGTGLELVTEVGVEDQHSVGREAHSGVNDLFGGSGDLPPNPDIEEGVFGLAAARLDGGGGLTRWRLGGDLLANGEHATARIHGWVRQSLWRGRRAATLALRSGVTTSDPLPQQAFRIGGLGTVRGFDYGSARGAAFWAAQLDVPLWRGWLRPVLFADAGQAADTPGSLFSSSALAGGGVGVVLVGVLRFDFSYPITGGGDGFRFDMSARAVLPW